MSIWFGGLAIGGTVAPSKSTPAAAIDEIASLLDDAGKASHDAESLESCLVAFTTIGSRLDVFELRFGIQPSAAPGWDRVRKRAKALLREFSSQSKQGIYFNRDSADASTCVLLELAGNDAKALAQLNKVVPGGGCGNWQATVMMAVEQRKSGIYQRRGDYACALAHEEASLQEGGLSLYSPASDLNYVRYAFLLAKTGEVARSTAQYQRVVDLYPATLGAELARAALIKRGSLIEPTAERLLTVYLEPERAAERDAAIFALAGHRFPESFDILTQRLKDARAWERNRLIPALGILGDKRAIPVLSEFARGKDTANSLHAIRSLHELGDDSETLPFLERLAKSDDALMLLDWTDQTLREVYGGGPKIVSVWETKPDAFVATWLSWIRSARNPATASDSPAGI